MTHESGTTLSVPAFSVGGRRWCARVSLPEAGRWVATMTEEGDGAPLGSTTVECDPAPPTLGGGLAVNPLNPRHFAYRDGSPCFLVSYEANWLWALQMRYPGEGRVKRFLGRIADYGFNCVLMNVFAYDTTWRRGVTSPDDYGPPPLIPWEGTHEAPDYTRFNLPFFDHFDRVMWDFLEAGIFAHLYFKVFNKLVRWPAAGSVAEEAYFRYVTARYQAFPSVVWDFAKESYYELDKELIRTRMEQVAAWDCHHRLRTVHDDPTFYGSAKARDSVDFFTVQQHHDVYASALLARTTAEIPYLNAEFGYECGPGGTSDVTYGVGQTSEELLRRAYRVVFGGGYPAYYYTYTAWDVIDEGATPPGYQLFKILADFANGVRVWEFVPDPSLCLWRGSFAMRRGSEEYLIFVCDHVLTPAELAPTRCAGRWIDIHHGREDRRYRRDRRNRASTNPPTPSIACRLPPKRAFFTYVISKEYLKCTEP